MQIETLCSRKLAEWISSVIGVLLHENVLPITGGKKTCNAKAGTEPAGSLKEKNRNFQD